MHQTHLALRMFAYHNVRAKSDCLETLTMLLSALWFSQTPDRRSTKSQQSDGQQGDGDGEGGEGASVPAANNGGMTARDGGMTARGNTSPSRRASQKELKPLQSQASSVSTLALGDDCGEPLGSARLPPVPGAEEVVSAAHSRCLGAYA